MEIIELEIASITKDKRTQPRAIIDDHVVNEYRADMLAGDQFPPVMVFQQNGYNYLADGWHRLTAAEQVGCKTISAAVKSGTLRDAILYSCGVNADHGKRRTNGDKERAVKKLLEDPEWLIWSDRDIAKRCRVTHPFVGKLRSSLVTVTSEKRKYTTKHGTVATMNTENIGQRPVSEPEPEPEEPAAQQNFFTTPAQPTEQPAAEPKYDPKNYRLFTSPVDQLSAHIEPDSVDAIITDPPYPKKYIHTYKELAEQAAIILRPGGILVALAGHPYIDQLIDQMKGYLTYHWLGCYYMPSGPHASLPHYSVSVYWKPLLIFVKGQWPNKAFRDVVINDEADKKYHEWGQGISGFIRLVEMFSKPNDTISDPFVGGGTTAIAALESGRYFIGSDIEAEQVEKTQKRLI